MKLLASVITALLCLSVITRKMNRLASENSSQATYFDDNYVDVEGIFWVLTREVLPTSFKSLGVQFF